MIRLTVIFLACLGFLVTGCAFWDKEVKLKRVLATQPTSQELEGLDVAIQIEDKRTGKPEVVGTTGWSLAHVKTKDDVAVWVAKAIESELVNAGGEFNNSATTKVICAINNLDASLGFLSLINSRLAIGVKVGYNGWEKALGEFAIKHSPFTVLDTPSAYEEAIAETLRIWMDRHVPTIISNLASIKSRGKSGPVEPTVDPEVTTPPVEPVPEPERPPVLIAPPTPNLTVTSPEPGKKTDKPSVLVSGRVENATGGELRVLVNADKKRARHLETSHEPFSFRLPIIAGKNEVKIILTDSRGKEITRNLINVTYAPPLLDNLRAIILGVSKFENLDPCPLADETCGKVREILESGVKQENRAHIHSLGAKTTVRNVLSALKKDLTATEARESLIVCYVGRLIAPGGEPAMAVHDTDKENPASAVLFSDVILAVERHFKGKAVVLIAQGPQSGEIGEAPELDVLETPLSILFYCPSQGNEKAVANGLAGGADADRDGYVTLSDLKSFLGNKGTAALKGNVDPGFPLSRIKISGN